MKKDKVLFFLKTPPPVTGATLMNKRVCNSLLLHEMFNIKIIEISYNKKTSGFGKASILKGFKFIYYAYILILHLIKNKPNLTYFQISPIGLSFLRDSVFVLLMKIFRVNIVFHLRGKGIKNYLTKNPILKNYYKIVFKNTSVICLSELLTYDIEDIHSGKIYIVHNGMPVYDFPRTQIVNEVPNVLFLSNLIKEKGILDFINALNILKEKNIKFKGTIVGEEADISEDFLLDYINNNNLSHLIEYKGPKYNNEKLNEYYNADIFVFPTYYSFETWGGVLLEAMQFELPVVSTSEASIPLIVDNNETGYIVEPQNPLELSKKIELLIKNPKLRKEMGKKGKEKFFKYFTFEIFEQNLSKTLKNILETSV